MYNVPSTKPIWRDIQRLVRELSGLHHVLAGHTVPLKLKTRYANLGFTIWNGVTTLAKQAKGKRYLLAANNAFDPAEVTWSGFGQAKSLIVLGENRRLKITGGTASDRFEPYGVHVYELE
jgi:hypothetical protein